MANSELCRSEANRVAIEASRCGLAALGEKDYHLTWYPHHSQDFTTKGQAKILKEELQALQYRSVEEQERLSRLNAYVWETHKRNYDGADLDVLASCRRLLKRNGLRVPTSSGAAREKVEVAA